MSVAKPKLDPLRSRLIKYVNDLESGESRREQSSNRIKSDGSAKRNLLYSDNYSPNMNNYNGNRLTLPPHNRHGVKNNDLAKNTDDQDSVISQSTPVKDSDPISKSSTDTENREFSLLYFNSNDNILKKYLNNQRQQLLETNDSSKTREELSNKSKTKTIETNLKSSQDINFENEIFDFIIQIQKDNSKYSTIIKEMQKELDKSVNIIQRLENIINKSNNTDIKENIDSETSLKSIQNESSTLNENTLNSEIQLQGSKTKPGHEENALKNDSQTDKEEKCEIRADLSKLQKEISDLQEEILQLKTQSKKSEEKYIDLQKQKENLSKDKTELKNKLIETESELRSELQKSEKKVENMNKLKNESDHKLIESVTTLNKQINTLNESITDLNNEKNLLIGDKSKKITYENIKSSYPDVTISDYEETLNINHIETLSLVELQNIVKHLQLTLQVPLSKLQMATDMALITYKLEQPIFVGLINNLLLQAQLKQISYKELSDKAYFNYQKVRSLKKVNHPLQDFLKDSYYHLLPVITNKL